MNNLFHQTEIVSVIGDLSSKQNQLETLIDEVKTTKENLVDYCRQVLFPNHYGTNPLFLRGISESDKEEIRKFMFPNHYNSTYIYKG